MSVSSMMQKDFLILLMVLILISFLCASGNTTHHLHFMLGCQAVIPCQHYKSDSLSFKWSYKKEEHSSTIQIYLKDKQGLEHHGQGFRPRTRLLHNGSLVIDHITEDDQGLYLCETCFENICRHDQRTVYAVRKEILKETHKAFYLTAGRSFTHACPGEFTNLKWTFEATTMTALRNSVQDPESHSWSFNKSIYIANVKREDAGIYTCWTSGCDGHWQKILIINVCVVTVHHGENSSVSCAVMCDMEFNKIKPITPSNVETGTMTISVHVESYGSLNCSSKQIFDGYSAVNSTHAPSASSNETTGIPTEHQYLIPVIYGTSATLTCLILIAFLICYLRPRERAVPFHLCCSDLNGSVVIEEENSVVYSSLVIRRPAKTTNRQMTDSECVYSDIKV